MTNSNKHHTPDSSTIKSIDHNGEKLIVEFKSGGTYHYDAPESVYNEMKAAPSAGKFLHANIKGKFNHAKLAIIAGLLLISATTAQAYTTPGEMMQRQIEEQHQEYARRDADYLQWQQEQLMRQQLEILQEMQAQQQNDSESNQPLSQGLMMPSPMNIGE